MKRFMHSKIEMKYTCKVALSCKTEPIKQAIPRRRHMDEGKRPLVLGEVSTLAQKWNRRPLAEPKAISSANSTHFVTLATNKLSESRKQGDRTSARSVGNSICQCPAVAEGVFPSKTCPSLVKSMAEEITLMKSRNQNHLPRDDGPSPRCRSTTRNGGALTRRSSRTGPFRC